VGAEEGWGGGENDNYPEVDDNYAALGDNYPRR